MGVDIKGKIIDTLIAAPLVDENRFRFDLNTLSKDYLQESKSEAQLYEAAKMWGLDPKGELWKLPASHVGEYAEQDATVTLRLWQHLRTEILRQNLTNIFELETDLFPVLFDMKQKGVRVDLDKAEKIKNDLLAKENKILRSIKKLSGVDVEVWAAASVAKAFENLTWHLILHQRGNQSLTRTFLRLTKVHWPRWLLNVEKSIKRERPSSKVLPSIHTGAGYTLRSTKCVQTKEEQ